MKNVEEALEYLYSLPEEEDATGIDISLEPPDDWAKSDGDDPSEDIVEVGEERVNLLGAKLLAKPPHIELTNRNSRPEPSSSWSMPLLVSEDQENSSRVVSAERSQPLKKKTEKRKK